MANPNHPLYELWNATNKALQDNAEEATRTNQLVQQWKGSKPQFANEFYQKQKQSIKTYRAELNRWFQKNPPSYALAGEIDEPFEITAATSNTITPTTLLPRQRVRKSTVVTQPLIFHPRPRPIGVVHPTPRPDLNRKETDDDSGAQTCVWCHGGHLSCLCPARTAHAEAYARRAIRNEEEMADSELLNEGDYVSDHDEIDFYDGPFNDGNN